MPRTLTNYLRTHRKRAHLTQDEVAFLLGSRKGAHVSRHERFNRQPSLPAAFAYEVLFRVPAKDLFAGLHEAAERAMRSRARALLKRLAHAKPTRQVTHKLAHLKKVGSLDGHLRA